jgi:hypothetical protein
MNVLGYTGSDDNGLSFELLIDEQPLGVVVGGRDSAIPYWIVDNDLPRYPPSGPTENPAVRIVAVCSCGEYGCGHTRCEVVHEDSVVVFKNFDVDVTPEGRKMEFRFAVENYKRVVSEIVAQVREYQNAQQTPAADAGNLRG